MEERNVHTFRNGAETRTLKFGRLETGEAYVGGRRAGATSPSSATTRPPTTCICSWSRSAPREKHLVTNAHSVFDSL